MKRNGVPINLLIAILGLMLLGACISGDDDDEAVDDDDDSGDDDQPDDDEDDDASDDDASDDDDDTFQMCQDQNTDWTVGLITCTDDAFEGYTLFAPLSSTTTYLIDIHGRAVHSWPSNYVPGKSVYLLEDGNLLRTASLGSAGSQTFQAGGAGGRVEIIDWEGSLLWSYEYAGDEHLQHHDVQMLPNGNVLLLAWERRTKDEAIAAGREPGLIQGELWVDHLVEVQPEGDQGGQIVWEWRLWDHMIQDFDPGKKFYGSVAAHPERVDINWDRGGKADWTHANAVAYHPGFDQVMISVLGFCELWVIDHSTTTSQAASHEGGNSGAGGDILFRWGNPMTYGAGDIENQQLYFQHDAHWIQSGLPGQGNILVFNNGESRPEGDYSTVTEIVPPTDAQGNYTSPAGGAFDPVLPTWLYQAQTPTDFYSPAISGAQRLPNGNTLICDGNHGDFFEVNFDGEVVWRYINPVVKDEPLTQGEPIPENALGTKNSVFRAYRYAPDYPGLQGKDLTGGEVIELPQNGS